MVRTYLKWFLLALFLCLTGITAWFLFGPPILEGEVSARVDPIMRAQFYLIRPGMSLKEVETIMGPAGPNFSSNLSRDYYIWKKGETWVSVILEGNGVTKKQIRSVPMDRE
jgi:hypothetical protein